MIFVLSKQKFLMQQIHKFVKTVSLLKHRETRGSQVQGVLLHWYKGYDKFTYVKPKCTLQIGLKKKPQKGALHWKSRPPVFTGLNRVEMLVLLLPHVGWREFWAWDVQIGPVILGGLHGLQVGGILLYVMSHLLISTISDVIPYQHLSHDSWPQCFLTPHLVPMFSSDFCWGFNY
jgi:hypothetical protein